MSYVHEVTLPATMRRRENLYRSIPDLPLPSSPLYCGRHRQCSWGSGYLSRALYILWYVESNYVKLLLITVYLIAFAICAGLLTNVRRSEVFGARMAFYLRTLSGPLVVTDVDHPRSRPRQQRNTVLRQSVTELQCDSSSNDEQTNHSPYPGRKRKPRLSSLPQTSLDGTQHAESRQRCRSITADIPLLSFNCFINFGRTSRISPTIEFSRCMDSLPSLT
jgi:hypothetical protein